MNNVLTSFPVAVLTNKLKLMCCDTCGVQPKEIIKVESKEWVPYTRHFHGRQSERRVLETKIYYFCETHFRYSFPNYDLTKLKGKADGK